MKAKPSESDCHFLLLLTLSVEQALGQDEVGQAEIYPKSEGKHFLIYLSLAFMAM